MLFLFIMLCLQHKQAPQGSNICRVLFLLSKKTSYAAKQGIAEECQGFHQTHTKRLVLTWRQMWNIEKQTRSVSPLSIALTRALSSSPMLVRRGTWISQKNMKRTLQVPSADPTAETNSENHNLCSHNHLKQEITCSEARGSQSRRSAASFCRPFRCASAATVAYEIPGHAFSCKT